MRCQHNYLYLLRWICLYIVWWVLDEVLCRNDIAILRLSTIRLWNIQVQTNVVIDVYSLRRISLVLHHVGEIITILTVLHSLSQWSTLHHRLRRLMNAWLLFLAIRVIIFWLINNIGWIVPPLANPNNFNLLIFFKIVFFSRDDWFCNFRHKLLIFNWLNAPKTFVTWISDVW